MYLTRYESRVTYHGRTMKSFWQHQSTEEQYKDRVLSIDHQTMAFTKNGKSMPFTVVNTNNWVIIIPRTSDGKFVMVRQYRIAADIVTLEFPGGAVNPDEDAAPSAIRELQEETGLETSQLTFLGEIAPNPALMSNKCFAYLAEGCTFSAKTQFDEFEDIEIVSYTQDELIDMMANGEINHSIVMAAYNLFAIRENRLVRK